MQEKNLLTDDTLVVVTADHCFPRTKALNDIPGYPGTMLSRIPLAFFSGQPLPKVDNDEFCSQLDFAPSMAHLLGIANTARMVGGKRVLHQRHHALCHEIQ
jgi:phosphoglycerol transferase MdoB-like AlkP superfamily enzyme